MIPITPQSRYDALVKLREGKIGREIFSDRDPGRSGRSAS